MEGEHTRGALKARERLPTVAASGAQTTWGSWGATAGETPDGVPRTAHVCRREGGAAPAP